MWFWQIKSCSPKHITFENSIPQKIPLVFWDGLKYDYHCIMKDLRVWRRIYCLGENAGNYKNFWVVITKEVKRIDKNGEQISKTISYIIEFIDSTNVMASLLSKLVDSFAEGVYKIKCKQGDDTKKYKRCAIKYKDCEWCLEYANVKKGFNTNK